MTWPITDVPTLFAIGIGSFIWLVAAFALIALWIDRFYKPDDGTTERGLTALALPHFAHHNADRAPLRRIR